MASARTGLSAILTTVLIIAGGTTAMAGNTVLIRAGTIYTAVGEPLHDGMILVRDGKIAEVGRQLALPDGDDTTTLEAAVVIPGLIDLHTHVGVYSLPHVEENEDGNEMTSPLTPQVRALDSFNFDDPAIAASLAGGVTTVISRPGSGNVIGGTSVAVKLKNVPPDEMVISEVCDLKMAIEGNPIGVYAPKKQMPSTLMAVYFLAEKAFVEAQEYVEKWRRYEEEKAEWTKNRGKKGRKRDSGPDEDEKEPVPPPRDLGKEHLAMALRREIPVHIHCATASEIMTSIRLAETFDLRLSLGHAYMAHLLVEELAPYRETVHFNIGPPMFFSYFDDLLTFKNNPAILSNAGFKVSLQTDAIGGSQQHLRHLASLCVRYGMKEEHALRSITLTAAEGVGLDQRIGSIEPGKDADLVLLDGEPFEILSEVTAVLIDGRVEHRQAAGEQVAGKQRLRARDLPPPAETRLQLPDDLDRAEGIAVVNGTVYPMAGEPISSGVVLIEQGKISAVGSDLSIPQGFTLIDAAGYWVLPGLVAPRSYLGLGSNWRRQRHIDETSTPVAPALQVLHAIEPQSPSFTFARQVGVTTVLVTPGDGNVIGGQGAVLKTGGAVVDRMIVKNRAVMTVGLGAQAKREEAMPTTRMGIAALLRETLVKAQEHRDKLARAGDDEPPARDLDLEALQPVLAGDTPVLVHCERRDDISTALRFAEEFNLRLILDGATDAYRLADELRQRDIPVILEDLFRGTGDLEDQGFDSASARLLSEAGVRIAFRPRLDTGRFTAGAGQPGGDLLEIAAFAVRNGMEEQAALRAVTIDAARIIGVDDRVGSLEPGKDADILILGGHPLATRSLPEVVLIEGKLVYRRQPGARLQ